MAGAGGRDPPTGRRGRRIEPSEDHGQNDGFDVGPGSDHPSARTYHVGDGTSGGGQSYVNVGRSAGSAAVGRARLRCQPPPYVAPDAADGARPTRRSRIQPTQPIQPARQPRLYGQQPGYGRQQARVSAPGAVYGQPAPPTGFAPPAGDTDRPRHTALPAAYGAPTGYGPPPAYGQPPGYPYGYGAPPASARRTAFRSRRWRSAFGGSGGSAASWR